MEHAVTPKTVDAEVVVIGGGIFGCCTAYHLLQAGIKDIVVVERAPEVATQTTWAGAGFVGLWSAGGGQSWSVELDMERYALQFYQSLGEQHGIGLKRSGMAWITSTLAGAKEQANRYKQALDDVTTAEVALLGAQEVSEVVPIIDPAHICSGLYWPTAIRVDAPLAARAVAHELNAAGVHIRTATEVTGIGIEDGQVQIVHTSGGSIRTRTVVNAAGAWAGEIARMAGCSLPLLPFQASRFTTKPIDGLPPDLPLLLFDYHGMYMREDHGGLLIGSDKVLMHGPELARHIGACFDGLDERQTMPDANGPGPIGSLSRDVSLLPTDLHSYHQWAAQAFASTVPILKDIVVDQMRSGLPMRTPDRRHLLGQVPGVRGFYVVGGDNEVGVTRGPGLAKLLAELIVSGSTSADISPYRLDRWSAQGLHV